MKCWHCNKELIWGGDHDIEEENEDFVINTASDNQLNFAIKLFNG